MVAIPGNNYSCNKSVANLIDSLLLGCSSPCSNLCVKDCIPDARTVIEKLNVPMRKLRYPILAVLKILFRASQLPFMFPIPLFPFC